MHQSICNLNNPLGEVNLASENWTIQMPGGFAQRVGGGCWRYRLIGTVNAMICYLVQAMFQLCINIMDKKVYL